MFGHSALCRNRPMATRKDTPKKFYSRSSLKETSSCCRLCKAVVDRRHSKDLFGHTNRDILNNAQVIYGSVFPRDNALPHLICRPCERRLENAMKFKKLIEETQKSFESVSRSKRCLEISPSVTQPSTSRACTSTDGSLLSSRRRSLDFTSSFPSDVSHKYSYLSVICCVSKMCYAYNYKCYVICKIKCM